MKKISLDLTLLLFKEMRGCEYRIKREDTHKYRYLYELVRDSLLEEGYEEEEVLCSDYVILSKIPANYHLVGEIIRLLIKNKRAVAYNLSRDRLLKIKDLANGRL